MAFAPFRQKKNVEALKRFLNAHPNLAKFEKAQLGVCAIFSILVIV
jgi:DNA-directed RNA polymerase II subunit RPB4